MKTFKVKISLIILFSIFSPNIHTFSQTLFWQSITEDIYVVDILYDGNQNLYFSGGSSQNYYFYRSTDLGNTWTQHGNGLNSSSLYLAIDSSGTLWGSRSGGRIYKSTNQGSDWINVYTYPGLVLSIGISPNNWIWAGTLDGKLLHSSDGGNNWDTENFVDDGIWSIGTNAANDIFVGVGYGKIYRTTNLGGSWDLVYEAPIQAPVREIVIDDAGYVYATKYKDRLISTDNGNTWNTIPGPELEILYLDYQHVFYGASIVGGYRSYDNCLTWSFIGPPWPDAPNAFALVDSLVFAGTNHGVFLYDPSYQPYLGQNYFPLTVGNTWQFNWRCNNHFAGNDIYYIDKDTVILNERYYLLQGEINDWVRYDEEVDKFYLRWNDSNYVVMDYTLNEGSAFQHILFNSHEIQNATIVEPIYKSIFDSSYHSKGLYWSWGDPTLWGSEKIYYSESIGESEIRTRFSGPGGTESFCTRTMIRAIIYDSTGVKYYSDHVKPIIDFLPVLVTDKFELNWEFTVDHYYSHFDENSDVNFIDSVLFFSYYSNGDTTFLNNPKIALNEPSSINYSISFLLDSTLMKNDYKFYYKIYAVDKGIVSEYSTSPDTGYYELIYDPNPVAVETNNDQITEYSLKQNYPNPFNPVTEIEYSIKDEGNVELIIFDVLGRKVKTLVNERQSRGNYKILFDASVLSSGIYLYQLRVNDFIDTKKMILLK